MADVKEFRKKPVVIQAIQWDGTLSGMDEILSVFTDIRTVAKTSHPPTNTCSFWKIGTLEGSHEVSAHDFVIRGVKGEYYPCKPDIFFMTYEPATTTPPADAALADDALIELVTDYAQSKVRAESCLYRYESAEYDKEAAETLEQIRAALRARQPAQAVAVPEGFVLVPVEPSESMVIAALKEVDPLRELIDWSDGHGFMREDVRRAWSALLAASKGVQPAQAVAVPDGVTEVRYLTDDRDLPQEEQHELVIRMSRNHDWYVMVVQKGHRFGPAVRLCTSGGASSHAPGLCHAIAEAFRAIAASKGGAV